MISTVYYPSLAAKMAMKIGSKYYFDDLFPRHIVQMAEEAQLSVALVRKETIIMLSSIQTHITDSPFTANIMQRVDKLSQRFQNEAY
jgi:serine/threonine-protein kinase HipA